VIPAGVVIVRQQDDVAILEVDGKPAGELAGASRITTGE
jgi:hypothetical protein